MIHDLYCDKIFDHPLSTCMWVLWLAVELHINFNSLQIFTVLRHNIITALPINAFQHFSQCFQLLCILYTSAYVRTYIRMYYSKRN